MEIDEAHSNEAVALLDPSGTVQRRGKEKFIYVKFAGSSDKMKLALNLSETIDGVKGMIMKMTGYRKHQQKLMATIGGEKIELEDGNRTLSSYDIEYGSTLSLAVPLGGGGITIFVKRQSAQDLQLNVNGTDTISTVLSQIPNNNNGEDIPQTVPHLEFKGQRLEGSRTLDDYKIKNNSKLRLVTRQSPPEKQVIEKEKKRWATYSRNALWFAITMFSTFRDSSKEKKSYTGIDIIFLITFGLSFLADAALAILLPQKWGNFLVYSSSCLLALVSYLLIFSFNGQYGKALFCIPILIIGVPFIELFYLEEEDQEGADTDDNQYLKHLSDLSCGIVNCGGFIAMVFGHHMKGEAIAVGYLFFITMVLGLYSMAVTTTRPELRPHDKLLATLLVLSLAVTLIIAVI